MKTKFSTSMMVANPVTLQTILPLIDRYTDMYHIDIMDGHFVPNLALPTSYIRMLKPFTTKPFDAHLMVTDPNNYIDELIKDGVDTITLHPGTIALDAFRIIDKIKRANVKLGIALSPSVGFETIQYYAHLIDKITIMSVEPGFAGQAMIKETLPKIAEARAYRSANNLDFLIEVDGSNNYNTFEDYVSRGADILVLGSCLFNADQLDKQFEAIKEFVHNVENVD